MPDLTPPTDFVPTTTHVCSLWNPLSITLIVVLGVVLLAILFYSLFCLENKRYTENKRKNRKNEYTEKQQTNIQPTEFTSEEITLINNYRKMPETNKDLIKKLLSDTENNNKN